MGEFHCACADDGHCHANAIPYFPSDFYPKAYAYASSNFYTRK
jgi:hypothetical protein